MSLSMVMEGAAPLSAFGSLKAPAVWRPSSAGTGLLIAPTSSPGPFPASGRELEGGNECSCPVPPEIIIRRHPDYAGRAVAMSGQHERDGRQSGVDDGGGCHAAL